MSKIEWTGETWNPLIGCDKVSEGCKNCYAIQTAWIRMHNPVMKEKYAGTVEKTANGKLNWTGKISMHFDSLKKPVLNKMPTTYFVNSMSDLFHKDVDFNFIYKVFEIMLLSPQHTFQVLTKRAERLSILKDVYFHLKRNYNHSVLPLPNVWLGVSVENQKAADERIPYLLQVPAAVRFLSCEPLLGPVEFSNVTNRSDVIAQLGKPALSGIDWVICGGESGPESRPMHPDWARSLRDQCKAADVPFFFKQWGEWHPYQEDMENLFGPDYSLLKHFSFKNTNTIMYKVGKKKAGRLLDGKEWNEYPKP